MNLHNVLHSEENRVARRMIVNQRNGGNKISWYSKVNEWLVKLDLKNEEKDIMRTLKSEWKRIAKESRSCGQPGGGERKIWDDQANVY